MFREVCSNKCLSRAWIFEWFKHLQDSPEDIEDGVPLGRSSTSITEKIFDIRQRNVHLHWVPEGQSNNKHYYDFEVYAQIRESKYELNTRIVKKNKTRLLDQDNSSAHTGLYIKILLAKYNIPMLDHTSYSSDLASSDFHLFPEIKYVLKEKYFRPLNLWQKSACVMKEFKEEGFQDCIKQWKIHIQRFRNKDGFNK